MPHYILTCIGPKQSPHGQVGAKNLSPLQIHIEQIKTLLSEQKIVIQKARVLASKAMDCVEITLEANDPIDPYGLMKHLASQKETAGIDCLIQTAEAYATPKRLIAFDQDSTLIQAEVIDELAKEAGVGEQVARVTAQAMNGEVPFPLALKARVQCLKGLSTDVMDRVFDRILLSPGASELISILKARGCITALLTGGFDYFSLRYKKMLNLDYAYSNHLEVKNNRLTGNIIGEIVDGQRKADLLAEIAKKHEIALNQTVAVGDGANDLPMMMRSGLGIAFNAKPSVREVAPYPMTQKSLTSILYLLGMTEDEIEEKGAA